VAASRSERVSGTDKPTGIPLLKLLQDLDLPATIVVNLPFILTLTATCQEKAAIFINHPRSMFNAEDFQAQKTL
jgi:hypothetical protein